MDNVTVIYGDEAELIDSQKNQIIKKYPNYEVHTYSQETPISIIIEALQQESLFRELKIIVLNNIPILKTSNNVKKDISEWDELYKALFEYNKDNPVILVFNSNLDKRLKSNKQFLESAVIYEYKKLSKDELINWSVKYCRKHNHNLTNDGSHYFQSLMEIWDDVPLTFLKTEFDRLFLFLNDDEPITANILAAESSDYGSKNIFKFMDAFYERDCTLLLKIIPFILQNREFDKFFAYLEGQLRQQIIVCECMIAGMEQQEIYRYMTEKGMNIKPYPIKLAYQRAKFLRINELKKFLAGMFSIVFNRRTGNIDSSEFERLCICYCRQKEKL